MKPYRSMLFVPGNRPSWIEKAADYKADAIILDLEDSVPAQEKLSARSVVKAGIRFLKSKEVPVYVRVNGFITGLTFEDLDGVLCPELDGIILPKVETIEDMRALDSLVSFLERRIGIPEGAIETSLSCETAKAIRNIYEIVISCPRIKRVTLAAGPGGDAARSVGYIWSKEGLETLYIRSKAVLDCRAAGIKYPMISSWWNVKDLEGLERDARWNRQLGFRGQAVIHPSHIPIVNKIYSPSLEEIEFYKGLIEAMGEARNRGSGAVIYKGDMVDEAMIKTAYEMLDFAKSIGLKI